MEEYTLGVKLLHDTGNAGEKAKYIRQQCRTGAFVSRTSILCRKICSTWMGSVMGKIGMRLGKTWVSNSTIEHCSPMCSMLGKMKGIMILFFSSEMSGGRTCTIKGIEGRHQRVY